MLDASCRIRRVKPKVRGRKGFYLTFGFRTAGTCVLAGLGTGGHGDPPLRLYGFIFITAGMCVRVGLCCGGSKPPPYAVWHLICLSLRLCGEKFAANPPPSSEGGKVGTDFRFQHSRDVVRAELCTGGHGVPPLRLLGFYFLYSRDVCPFWAVYGGRGSPPLRVPQNRNLDATIPPSDEGGAKTERSDVLTEGETSPVRIQRSEIRRQNGRAGACSRREKGIGIPSLSHAPFL